MRHFLYIPWTFGWDNACSETVDRYKKKYGAKGTKEQNENFLLVSPAISGKPLTAVQPDDLLLIWAHGTFIKGKRGSVGIENDFGIKLRRTLTQNELADQLLSEGLGKKHQFIKLLSCWGGGEGAVKDTVSGLVKVIDKGQDKDGYFAQKLAAAMGERHCSDIRVGGYIGPVYSGSEHKMVGLYTEKGAKLKFDPMEDKSGRVKVPTRAMKHELLRWFNAQGNEVPYDYQITKNFDKAIRLCEVLDVLHDSVLFVG